MARLLLPLLFSTVSLLLPCGAADTAQARCSRPKDVANARIDVGNNTLLNARLRYVCNPGYKRKAGTSSLIQCILRDGSKPDWTHTTLQCIRDPALPPLTPSPELLTTLHTERMTQRGTGDANLTSSPSPAAMPMGAAGQPPVPPAPDGSSPETSMAPELPLPLETSTLGEGTTPLPTAPPDHAAGQATSPREITHPRGWCQPAKAFFTFSVHFPLSPTPFGVRVPSASSSSLALQLKISISLLFSSFCPEPHLFHW
ncbi:PREDICTED: interleukin-15 receptor subunit alpha [Calidris pugnax]|uniref:interleukin-15 receptor subunit alpha n=1 Tax=Calidris pugnax TaxID=198806 RepID=UPI00071DA2D8|nr:PREDICTED: interleukin-15 receptor subunit alpha [Calidris pugnax]